MTELSDSNTNKDLENSSSIADLVQKEVEKWLHDLQVKIEACVKKDEVSKTINEYMKDKLPLQNTTTDSKETSTKFTKSSPPLDEGEMEVTLEFSDNNFNSQQIHMMDSFSELEKRVHMLESRVTDLVSVKGPKNIPPKFMKDENEIEHVAEKINNKCHLNKPKSKVNPNTYDDLYYEWRQNKMNLLTYKKSEETLQLNRIPERDPILDPVLNRSFIAKFRNCQK